MKKTLFVLALLLCLSALLVSCDSSVSQKDENDDDSIVYAPVFQLTQESKAIDFNGLVEYFENDGMNANNALFSSLQLPSLIGFEKKSGSDARRGYTQTILGKEVFIKCRKGYGRSYVFEGSTADDSIYIRTVAKPDNSVDFLEMKKVSVPVRDEEGKLVKTVRLIFAAKGTVTINPFEKYQTGAVTVYGTDDSDWGFNAVFPAQFYLSDSVTASVMDASEGSMYAGLSNFDSHYEATMDYRNALAFIADVASVENKSTVASTLNLCAHRLENNLYFQNIYMDEEGKCFWPESAGQTNRPATGWDDMQKYVSFITDGNWTLKH